MIWLHKDGRDCDAVLFIYPIFSSTSFIYKPDPYCSYSERLALSSCSLSGQGIRMSSLYRKDNWTSCCFMVLCNSVQLSTIRVGVQQRGLTEQDCNWRVWSSVWIVEKWTLLRGEEEINVVPSYHQTREIQHNHCEILVCIRAGLSMLVVIKVNTSQVLQYHYDWKIKRILITTNLIVLCQPQHTKLFFKMFL